jgi:hypothetical protein
LDDRGSKGLLVTVMRSIMRIWTPGAGICLAAFSGLPKRFSCQPRTAAKRPIQGGPPAELEVSVCIQVVRSMQSFAEFVSVMKARD